MPQGVRVQVPPSAHKTPRFSGVFFFWNNGRRFSRDAKRRRLEAQVGRRVFSYSLPFYLPGLNISFMRMVYTTTSYPISVF